MLISDVSTETEPEEGHFGFSNAGPVGKRFWIKLARLFIWV